MAKRDGSNIDHIRATITKKLLEFTSKTLEYLSEEGGLTFKSAQAICEMLLPGINGVAVAITDTTTILGYAGESEDGNPAGAPFVRKPHVTPWPTGRTVSCSRPRISASRATSRPSKRPSSFR